MADVFISYSIQDEKIATFLQRHLTNEGLKVFMASVTLAPGQRWGQEILKNLKNSEWVLFLASKTACESPFVQQELGAALIMEKKLIPIVWNIKPSNLPGWIKQVQALDLAGMSLNEACHQISGIAERIKADKLKGYLIVGFLIAGLIYFASKK